MPVYIIISTLPRRLFFLRAPTSAHRPGLRNRFSDISIRGGRVNWYQRLTWYSTDMEGRRYDSRLSKIAFYADVDCASASPGVLRQGTGRMYDIGGLHGYRNGLTYNNRLMNRCIVCSRPSYVCLSQCECMVTKRLKLGRRRCQR